MKTKNEKQKKKQRHKRVVWLNVYEDGTEEYVHPNKEEADASARDGRIACLKIVLDFVEGEGL